MGGRGISDLPTRVVTGNWRGRSRAGVSAPSGEAFEGVLGDAAAQCSGQPESRSVAWVCLRHAPHGLVT